jgi:hypothetical protein
MNPFESYHMLLFVQTARETQGLWARFSESFVFELGTIMPGLIERHIDNLTQAQPSLRLDTMFDPASIPILSLKQPLEIAVDKFMVQFLEFGMPALRDMLSPIASPTGELSWSPKKVIRFEGLLNFAMQLLRYILCGESELTASVSPDSRRQITDAFGPQREAVVRALESFDVSARDLFSLLVSRLVDFSLACLITAQVVIVQQTGTNRLRGHITRSHITMLLHCKNDQVNISETLRQAMQAAMVNWIDCSSIMIVH